MGAPLIPYVCPECGYDGFKASTSRSDYLRDGYIYCCPRCFNVDGKTVQLNPKPHLSVVEQPSGEVK